MSKLSRLPFFVGVIAVLAVVVAGCGGSDESESSAGGKAIPEEQAFLKGMIPHHESAVEMAEIAQKQGQHREVKELARKIVADQKGEIRDMERIYKRLYGEEIMADPAAHERLGLSAKEAGMEHMEMDGLSGAKPFDRAFIDQMIGHHQGAIRMAYAVMESAKDAEVKELAGSIVEAQASEIEQMNSWRKRWYGKASPAGTAPKPEMGDTKTMPGGEHGGH